MWKVLFCNKMSNKWSRCVHRYFVLSYCFKGIVHVNTDVVKWRWIITSFWSVSYQAQSVNRWCFLIKVHNLFLCFGQLWRKTLSCLPLREKSHARLLLFLLECIVEQLLHKFLWLMFPPLFVLRGGSVCLSWLLETSLSIKWILICIICFDNMWRIPWVIHWYCNTKKMSAVVYIIRPSVYISFYFLFSSLLGDLFCCNSLACFTFLWFHFGNKILWKTALFSEQ